MYVEWSELSKNFGNPKYKNFLKTFGGIVVKNFFEKKEFKEWREEYANCYLRQFKTPIETMMKQTGQAFVPNFVDNSEYFAKKAFDDRFMSLAKYFCGDDFYYLGSDGSAFSKHSFRWHRDWFTSTPVIKFNIYLNPTNFFGGDFLLVPGSHIPSDAYAGLLNKGLAWPFGETVAGGLNERDFFPHTPSPRIHFLKLFARRFTRKFNIPFQRLKVANGDLVIFDQRAIHVVERTFPTVTRRLLTLLFAENPQSLPDSHFILNPPKKETRESLSQEIRDLFWLERQLIKIPPYGKYITKNHPLYEKHLLTHSTSLEMDKSIESGLSKYGAYIDRTNGDDKNNVWYTETMLGFNISKLRKIDC